MKMDIILAGVGGQGILSVAAAIGYAAINEGLHIKQAEVHGMSQRGGVVQSHFRISDQPIYSELIPLGKADMILSLEPMEALRYLPYLGETGWLISNEKPMVNIVDYPDADALYTSIRQVENHVLLDTDKLARKVGTAKASNMALLGAASAHLPLKEKSLEKGIRQLFKAKGEKIMEMNINAFIAGRSLALEKDAV
ncbi:MAG TPA: indolepyruvate oxidoreductase subunit beta [Cytophagales bacterium]|jgi:indolepyruvate ferredoxin oxidoreductase beta subunit|nr:indolepyruvate oxidoreductase subunit beta [Cytophagales bacterium]